MYFSVVFKNELGVSKLLEVLGSRFIACVPSHLMRASSSHQRWGLGPEWLVFQFSRPFVPLIKFFPL